MALPLTPTMPPAPRPSVREDLAWGVRQGAFYAAAFSVLGVLGYAFGNSGFRADVQARVFGCLAVYWVTGALGGLLVGASRRWLGRLGVALAAGAAVGVLFAMACVVLGEGPRALLDRGMWAAGGCTGIFLGVLCAALRWHRWRSAGVPGAEAGAPVA